MSDRHQDWPARLQFDPTVFIAPGAVVVGEVTLGARASIWFNTVVRGDTLLTVLDQMVLSPARMAVRVELDGRVAGVITRGAMDPHLPQAGTGW